jgi:primosomal protein N' (replication factor Y) (superfamily II helicase)
VDVCVAVPKLSLDRPFTYLLPADAEAGTGSLVSVPFHGRTLKGWVLGPPAEVPEGRLLPVRKVRSTVRFFDPSMLALLRWMADRYIAPLSTVIERSYPPRVASEELGGDASRAVNPGSPRVLASLRAREAYPTRPPSAASRGPTPRYVPSHLPATAPEEPSWSRLLERYGGEAPLLEAGVTSWLRPLPRDEAEACVAAVAASLARGRRAIVVVPEADPLPATAGAVLGAFGPAAVAFVGGDDRERYRTWLQIRSGAFDVVVGTRPAVFAPLEDLGLMWISREVHPGHREERSPYFHSSEVSMARARLHGAACVLASFSPSTETAAAVGAGSIRSARPSRPLERASAALVETTAPEGEDRSVRLGALLKRARSAALIVSRRGYGVARVCRSCGEPAACASCRGPIVIEGGAPVCHVCRRPGVCAVCGNGSFGVERGGAERVAEWAGRISPLPVEPDSGHGPHPVPGPGRTVVGTAATVKDVGPLALDLVVILDPDRALFRAGRHAGEQALATWMEAAAWAAPREGGGRVLVQTRRTGHPAIQALVRSEPVPFLRAEAALATEAGFPPGHPVFRVAGASALEDRLRAAGAGTVLATSDEKATLCLVAVPPEAFEGFRGEVRRLAAEGIVTRVEAEPQL